MEETKKAIRLNIELEEEMRYKLKEIALKRHVTLKDYVLGVLSEAIELEEKYEQ